MTKRILDIVFASILLVLTAPVQAAVAALVASNLGRPILFTQERAGMNGSRFRLVKFRSMRPQAAKAPFLTDEQRMTGPGRALRRFRLDELPQLWLILRGKMAFVGPRPLYPDAHSLSNEELFRYRHRVRPGLTGWAQVNGNTLLEEREKLALDAVYVERSSLLFDLTIVMMTVGVILGGERRNEIEIAEALRYADRIGRDS